MEYRHWLEEADPPAQKTEDNPAPANNGDRSAVLHTAAVATHVPAAGTTTIQTQILHHESQLLMTWKLAAIGTLLFLALIFFCLEKLNSGHSDKLTIDQENLCQGCVEAVSLDEPSTNAPNSSADGDNRKSDQMDEKKIRENIHESH